MHANIACIWQLITMEMSGCEGNLAVILSESFHLITLVPFVCDHAHLQILIFSCSTTRKRIMLTFRFNVLLFVFPIKI